MTPEELFRAVLHGPVGVDSVQVIAAECAAAEERGRRRGVIAQWGKIHELLALVDELADDLAPFTGERVGAKWNRLRAGIEDLAPRDSGKDP